MESSWLQPSLCWPRQEGSRPSDSFLFLMVKQEFLTFSQRMDRADTENTPDCHRDRALGRGREAGANQWPVSTQMNSFLILNMYLGPHRSGCGVFNNLRHTQRPGLVSHTGTERMSKPRTIKESAAGNQVGIT